MDLFKKLRKGMSVLLVASMITGMMFPTSGVIVYAEESDGTGGSGSSTGTPSGGSGNESTPTDTGKDINSLTPLELFKTSDSVVGSELKIADINTHVLSVSGDSLSVAIKQKTGSSATLVSWDNAVGLAKSYANSINIFTPNSEPGEYSDFTELDDIKFFDCTNQMLSVKDVITLDKALSNLQKPYWLGSEVVGSTKDGEATEGKKYSVAAYVDENGKIDIAEKTTLKNVYVKTNTDKVQYIYLPDDMEKTGWIAASSAAGNSGESSTGYNALYAISENSTGVKLEQYTGSVSEDKKYTLVAKTSVTAKYPESTSKVLVAVLNADGQVVMYQVVSVSTEDNQSTISTTVPDVVGEGSLKMIAFADNGEIKGESEYKIQVEAQQELGVTFAGDNSSELDIELTFTDATDSNYKASSEATINLNVTKPNYYSEPVIGDFLLSTETDATKVEQSSNKVTSVTISQYESNAEGSTLTVNSTTNFTAKEMQTYAAEKEVYLYCLNQNTKQYIKVGKITIDRQYISEFAYDNTEKTYTYGDLNSQEDTTTHANQKLSMNIKDNDGHLKGVYEFLSSINASEESTPSIVTKEAELVWLSRNQGTGEKATQFLYKKDDTDSGVRVNNSINVGTYTTASQNVEAGVYGSNGSWKLLTSTDANSKPVFKFIIQNTGERIFEITKRKITLQTTEQTVNDTEEVPYSDSSRVQITLQDGTGYTLTYGDTLKVKLTKDENKNIIFSNLSDTSEQKYQILNDSVDVTENYQVTLSETYGKFITTSLSAELYADNSSNKLTTTVSEDDKTPIHTVTYDAKEHSVIAKPGKITDAENAQFVSLENTSGVTVNYQWKLYNPSAAGERVADFTDSGTNVPKFTKAGKYLVEYTVSLTDFNNYTGTYYVEIKPKEVTVTIQDQTYQYTNVADQSYFKQFDAVTNTKCVSAEGLLGDDSITAIKLEPQLTNSTDQCTGTGKITADVSTVTITSVEQTKNYDINIVDGTLTVKKATIVADITDVSGTYQAAAYTITPSISAQYSGADTSIDDKLATVYYYTLQAGENELPADASFKTELPDLTSAGNRTVYYYVEAAGYTSSTPKSFSVDIKQKDLTISLNSQTVTYPDKIAITFDTAQTESYAVATGLIDSHTVRGAIKKTEVTPGDSAVYKTGTLTVAKKDDTEVLDVTVLDGNKDVTANYNILDTSTGVTYTINKNTFTTDQIQVNAYSGIYDSTAHDAVQVTPDNKVFVSETDKIYYCLFKDGEFTDVSLGSIKDSSTDDPNEKVWSESVPKVEDAGTYQVAYKIVKEGYNDYISSVPVIIQQADLTLYVLGQSASFDKIVLKADKTNAASYVTPIGLQKTDAIDSIEFYSEELNKSEDGIVTNVPIDVKKDESGKYLVVIKKDSVDVTSNYKITSISGLLSVKKSTLNVVATSKTVTYNAQAHNILELLTINGKPAKEAIAADSSIKITCSTDGIKYEPVEKYTQTKPGTLKLYYRVEAKGYGSYISSTPVTLMVTKKPLTIKIYDQKVTYGSPFNEKDYYIADDPIVGDLVTGHKLDISNFKLTVEPFENGAATGTTVINHNGQIQITDDEDNDVTDCYELTQETPAYYTVSPAEISNDQLSIIVDNEEGQSVTENLQITKGYRAEAYSVAITSKLPGYSVTYSINENPTNSLSFINAGTYTVTATVSATGYAEKTVSFTFTINPQVLTIVLASQTITYGEDIAQPSGKYGNIESSNGVFASITGIQGYDTITVNKIQKRIFGDVKFQLRLEPNDVTVDYAKTECSGYNNYIIRIQDAELTVNRRAISMKPVDQKIKDAQTVVTDITAANAAQYISVDGLCEGDYIDEVQLSTSTICGEPDAFTNKDLLTIGSVIIKNSEGENVTYGYQITKNPGFVFVESMPITIADNEVVYDGKAHGAKITVADGYSFDLAKATIKNSDVVTDVTTNAKTITVTVKAEGYQDKTATVTVTVTKRPLLITVLDQDDLALNTPIVQIGEQLNGKEAVAALVGETIPDNKVAVVMIAGLVEGQVVNGIQLTADTSQIGKRDITVDKNNIFIGYKDTTTATSSNYDVTYRDGSVYVNPAAITISRGDSPVKGVVSVSHTYDGTSPLGNITTNPSEAKLTITVNGQSAASLEAAQKATVNAGNYTVMIKAECDNYETEQLTILINIAKSPEIKAEAVGVYDGSTTKGYVVPVPSGNTSYELAVDVTSGKNAVDASNYTIQYATSENGSYADKLELKTAGKHTVYYKVTVQTDNFADKAKGEVIIGSAVVTICDHSDATFTKVTDSIYTCNECQTQIYYNEYQVLGVMAIATENDQISVLPADQTLLLGTDNGNYSYQPVKLGPNEKVILDATKYKTGTNVFKGWYLKADLVKNISGTYYVLNESVTPVSTSLKWVYTAGFDKQGENDSYIAVFKENITKVTLTAEAPETDGKVKITVGDVTTEANTTVTKSDIVQGSKVTVTAKANNGYTFAYWTNEANIVLSDKEEYTFTLTGNTTVKAVFVAQGKVTVNTYNKYGQSIKTQSITVGENAETAKIVNAPAVLDFDFTGWKLELVKDRSELKSAEYQLADYQSEAEIQTALQGEIAEIVQNNEYAGCEVKLTPLYKEVVKETFKVKVVNGIITNNNQESIDLTATTVVTVKPNEALEGYKFAYWIVENVNKPISYNETYSFYASEAITVQAVYVKDAEPVKPVATTDITKFAILASTDKTKNKFSFVSTTTVPEGCTMEKVGIRIWKKTATVSNSGSLGDATAEKGLSSTATTYNYTYNVSIRKTDNCILYLQPFVTYVDENGERNTVDGKYYQVDLLDGQGNSADSLKNLQLEDAFKTETTN